MTTATRERPQAANLPASLPIQHRDFAIPADAMDVEARTVELCFSSELPYERWWGTEILDHATSSVRMDRLANGAALLVDHDVRDHIGVVVRAWVDGDRKGRALVRFGRSERADEIFRDVQDGIRKLVSVGYRIHTALLEKSTDTEDTYRVTDWEPYEISIVAVPADPSVGIGRSAEAPAYPVFIERAGALNPPKESIMAEATNAPAAPSVDVQVQVTEAQRAERARVQHILAAGEQHGLADLARSAVDNGTSVADFNASLLEKLQAARKIRPAESPELGLSEKERNQFSFRKLLLAVQDPANYESEAGFELECSKAAQQKRGKEGARDGARTIPVDMLYSPLSLEGMAQAQVRNMLATLGSQKRDLTAGTNNAGGYTVATDLLSGSFIELLRNAMVLDQLGVTMLTDLNGNIAIPSQTGGATAYWVAENGAPTESQQTFGQVTLSPKTVGAYTDYSRRLLLQSSLSVEAFVRADLAMTLGLAIDLAAIAGTGSSNQPTGILSTGSIGSVVGGTDGAAPDYADIVDLENAVDVANANVGNLAYLTNSKVRGKLRKTEMFSGTNGIPVWGADNTLLGYKAVVSQQVPSNLTKGSASGVCSAIIYGNWRDLVIGMWGGLDLMVDPYSLSTTGGRRVVALQDVDVAVRHAASFAAMVDALTA